MITIYLRGVKGCGAKLTGRVADKIVLYEIKSLDYIEREEITLAAKAAVAPKNGTVEVRS